MITKGKQPGVVLLEKDLTENIITAAKEFTSIVVTGLILSFKVKL